MLYQVSTPDSEQGTTLLCMYLDLIGGTILPFFVFSDSKPSSLEHSNETVFVTADKKHHRSEVIVLEHNSELRGLEIPSPDLFRALYRYLELIQNNEARTLSDKVYENLSPDRLKRTYLTIVSRSIEYLHLAAHLDQSYRHIQVLHPVYENLPIDNVTLDHLSAALMFNYKVANYYDTILAFTCV